MTQRVHQGLTTTITIRIEVREALRLDKLIRKRKQALTDSVNQVYVNRNAVMNEALKKLLDDEGVK